jgi:hypothetical protein
VVSLSCSYCGAIEYYRDGAADHRDASTSAIAGTFIVSISPKLASIQLNDAISGQILHPESIVIIYIGAASDEGDPAKQRWTVMEVKSVAQSVFCPTANPSGVVTGLDIPSRSLAASREAVGIPRV